ncbi:site-specific integrase [Vibrio parahaemolyticus]|uniref:site-specific integrase n=2 Tax=Vibrio TaxID=662 RepID=UPI00038E51E2|nr:MULTISPECIES: site-specific integrase [Vibrio harveyi group]EGQ9098707.1 tyrosine-type recombinase/integrase [Vibrio alginolyticus]EJG0921252.1 site-specific integrase [Vibrio parahaemolyticus O1:K68]EJG0930466.1 site-specific integrase [Vibrio parahaemolyticus O1]EJG0945079.1 site-specific integrase [Vibrio parahaemolyticus O10]EJG0951239.1 site-specific integrase [Vibrio parahaemolyticus O1:K58]EQM49045.1 phage integrase family protein [Vibrio parahaemolyticus VPCR-2010]
MQTLTPVTIPNPTLNTPIPICVSFYVEVKAQYHKSYLGTIRYRLERISKHFASFQVRDLTTSPNAREHINSFIESRLKVVKSGTVRKDVSTLQAMINWLRRDIGLQIPDIFKQIRIPKDYGVRQFVPTDEQVYKVIGNLPTDELKDICLLLSETACRRNEILKLRIQDVHLDKRYIQLYDTKNGEDRRVPLSNPAMAVLSKRLDLIEGKAETYPLFSVMPEFVSKQFRKAADKEGLSDFVLHSLRHYRLSKLIGAGHDSILVSKVSGHKDHRMLNRYVKLDATNLASLLFD